MLRTRQISSAIAPTLGSISLISIPDWPYFRNGLIAGTTGHFPYPLDIVDNRVLPRTLSGMSLPAIVRMIGLGSNKLDLPLSGIEMFEVRFPSPVKSPYPENNTVYAEYYRPKNAKGPIPCVVVLDILAGNQKLPEVVCQHLAQNGIGGLFVQMAYYGPRRPRRRVGSLLSTDIGHTMEAVRQTVLDLRCAAAWMEARPEIDKDRLGIMGISLGSFMAALAAEMEPTLWPGGDPSGRRRLRRCLLGRSSGRLRSQVFRTFRRHQANHRGCSRSRRSLTCAERLKTRKLLMVAAKNDEIVPPRMAENLWNATGRQQIVWLNAGHYTAILYLPAGLKDITELFGK